MDPLGWILGLGFAGLTALLAPILFAVVLLGFVPRVPRAGIVALACVYGCARAIGGALEQPLSVTPAVVIAVFAVEFGYATLVAAAVAVVARLLIAIARAPRVRRLLRLPLATAPAVRGEAVHEPRPAAVERTWMRIAGSVSALSVLVTAGAALLLLRDSQEDLLRGGALEVRVGAARLCVGRQFIEPETLFRAVRNSEAVTDGAYARVELALFSLGLTGFTAEHYRAGIARVYDKREYPADWVRITMRPRRSSSPVDIAALVPRYYGPDWAMDSGFRSHVARSDCISKPGNGPECHELKHGHAADPSAVLVCNSQRCWLQNRTRHQSVWFDYDFPRAYLSEWPALHKAVHTRISEWSRDNSCYP